MKKKIASLLAAVMVLSPVSAFAATNNRVDQPKNNVPKKTLYLEETWKVGSRQVYTTKGKDVTAIVSGTNLRIAVKSDKIYAGDQITVTLENASWYFTNGTSYPVVTIVEDLATVNSAALTELAGAALDSKENVRKIDADTKDKMLANGNFADAGTSYDITKGHLINTSTFSTDYYYRLAGALTPVTNPAAGESAAAGELPYILKFDPNNSKVATLVMLEDSHGTATPAADLPYPVLLMDGTDYVDYEGVIIAPPTVPFEGTVAEIAVALLAGGFAVEAPLHPVQDIDSLSAVPTGIPDFRYLGLGGDETILDPANAAFAYDVTLAAAQADPTLIDLAVQLIGKTTPTSTGGGNEIVIPLVTLVNGDGDAKVTIEKESNKTNITSNTYQFGSTYSSAKTVSSIASVVESKFTFELGNFEIKELVNGTIKAGKFYLEAPYGYYFGDPTNKALTIAGYPEIYFAGGAAKITNTDGLFAKYKTTTNSSGTVTDKSILVFDVSGLTSSITQASKLTINNLVLVAEDDASYNKDVFVKVYSDSVSAMSAGITSEEVKVAVRRDWAVTVELDKDQTAPTLVNGRYEVAENLDLHHKAARIVFKENTVASWWAERQTELTLPDGVKFIQVKLTDSTNITPDIAGTYESSSTSGSRAYVRAEGSKVILTDLKITDKKKASFKMESWLSIESGFEGDIVLTVKGSSILESENEVAKVVIAKAVSPITIDTKVTDVVIGYQWQPVADFTLTETGAGRLLRDRQINITNSDGISADEIFFAPDMVVEKSGNITITKPVIKNRNITFSVDRQSVDNASAIKFSNVYVKVDRTVPESNKRPYKLVAAGQGIARNYKETYKNAEPFFSTMGLGADYLNVVTPATNQPGTLTSFVQVQIDSPVVKIGLNGEKEITMDTAAYISAASNSAMVPVRFVAQALGVANDQINWDDENRTATILTANRIIKFQAGSAVININGVEQTMYSPDNPPIKVVVEMKDNRAFLPFRHLGNALGVTTDWDATNRIAMYNEPESHKAVVPVVPAK